MVIVNQMINDVNIVQWAVTALVIRGAGIAAGTIVHDMQPKSIIYDLMLQITTCNTYLSFSEQTYTETEGLLRAGVKGDLYHFMPEIGCW